MSPVFLQFLLIGGVTSLARLKRQALPSNHVQVHSINSNVSVTDVVVVTSSDSRIDLTEKKLNLSTWATSSNVSFDTFDTFVNYTAVKAETFARLQGLNLHGQAENSEFSMTTDKKFDSNINNSLTGRVNLSVADSGMRIQALEGKWADVTASTREDNKTAKSMNIYSNMSLDSRFERRLTISAVDRLYDMEAVLLGARVRTTYGDVTLDIDSDYRTARIYTIAHTIELKTTLSPFGIEFNNERMLISAPFEETTAKILKNSSDVHFIVGQLSQLRLSRGGGQIQLGGNVAQADRINVTSMNMTMDLFSTREMDARTNQSHISMITNKTTASLTSLFHHLHVSGGVPQMGLFTGNVSINISTKPATPIQPTLFPGFSAPPDKFSNIGPSAFPGDGSGNNNNGWVASRSTAAPSIDGSTEGEKGEVTVVTQSSATDEEIERTVGYRTPAPATTDDATLLPAATTIGEVMGVSTVVPVEGGIDGQSTTENSLIVSPDVTLQPTEGVTGGDATTEQTVAASTDGASVTEGQTAGAETVGETQGGQSSTQSSGEGTSSVPAEATTIPSQGETTSGSVDQTTPAGEETTLSAPDQTTVGNGESTTVSGGESSTGAVNEQTTLSSGTESSSVPTGEEGTTAAPGDASTDGSVLLTTILSIDTSSIRSETIPSDFPRPATGYFESTTDHADATTVSASVYGHSTIGDFVTPPVFPTEFIIPTDFVTPGSLNLSTEDWGAVAQFTSDSIPDRGSLHVFATIASVQLPDGPTPLTAQQQIEPDIAAEPEALTSIEKRSPISRTESFRVRLRMPRKVNTSDSSFTRELTRNVIEIANRTLESSNAMSERRKRNVEVDPIMLNVTDVHQLDENEAEVKFAVGLHSFDNIDELIDALKKSIPNGSENGIVIIERIVIHTTVSEGSSNWIIPVILLLATIIIIALAFVAHKVLHATIFKNLPICCDRSPRVADSASFRSFS